MTLEKFIKRNRKQIDKVIKRMWPRVKLLNDAERKVWVLNEDTLLHWVQVQGVKIPGEWQGPYSYDFFLAKYVRPKETSD